MSREDVQDALTALTRVVRDGERSFAAFAWRCLAIRGANPAMADVEDVLSDAYLTAATRLRSEPGLRIERLDAWFRKILFFKCLRAAAASRKDGIRRVAASLEAEDRLLDVVDRSVSSSEDLDRHLFVKELLGTLDIRARSVVEMSAAGFTSAEIGRDLNEQTDNVRQIRSRALSRLRRALKRSGREEHDDDA
jgi:RNA polymerase sigma factor (sigma-70 family)